jgi:hypothetical protein
MSWKRYFLFLLASFVACLLFFFFYPWPQPTQDSVSVGVWRDFNQDNFIVEIDSNRILILKNGPVLYQQKGNWANHAFYCDSHLDAPAEFVVARELANEDLELEMKYFDPNDGSVITCTKIMRGAFEIHPYPTSDTPGLVVTYPPPKGLIRVGMLEADLSTLPWASSEVDIQDDNSNSLLATNIYRYRSDNPNLPELRVTVLHGRVTAVSGGAEDTGDAPYVLPPPAPPPSANSNNPSLAVFLFDLFFKK